jgi:hypothetical protein
MIRLMRWAVGAFVLGFVANRPTTLVIINFAAADASLAAKVSMGMVLACIGGIVAVYIRGDPWLGLM